VRKIGPNAYRAKLQVMTALTNVCNVKAWVGSLLVLASKLGFPSSPLGDSNDRRMEVHHRGCGRRYACSIASRGIVHAQTVYRDPRLAALSPEELQSLDALTKKLALPAPDGPPNQMESAAALNAIDVECEHVETLPSDESPT
jgi:hypothetical protein